MIQWIKTYWNQWCEIVKLINNDEKNSKYMSHKWNSSEPICPMCCFKLEYDDVLIDGQYVRSVVGCPSCGWNVDERVK